MALILRFETARRPHAPRGGAFKGPAKILFFTGVRYERQPILPLIETKSALSKARRGSARAKELSDLSV